MTTQVAGISYSFDRDSKCHTALVITPAIHSKFGSIERFLTEHIKNKDTLVVGAGDTIRVNMDASGYEVEVIHRVCETPAPIVPRKCPFCGADMLYHDKHDAYGYCLNRSCLAQLSRNVTHFAQAIGRPLTGQYFHIADMLLSKGSFRSPADLFRVPLDDILALPNVTAQSAQEFLTYIHGVRGTRSVTVEQLLRGLNVPGWGELEYALVRNTLAAEGNEFNYSVISSSKFRNMGITKWSSWHTFIGIPENEHLAWKLIDYITH